MIKLEWYNKLNNFERITLEAKLWDDNGFEKLVIHNTRNPKPTFKIKDYPELARRLGIIIPERKINDTH